MHPSAYKNKVTQLLAWQLSTSAAASSFVEKCKQGAQPDKIVFPHTFAAQAVQAHRTFNAQGVASFMHDPLSVIRFLDAAWYIKDIRLCKVAWTKGVKA